MRNLAGAYIDLGDQNGFYAPENIPLYSLSSPVYQQALLAGALHAVDLGADGMTFDNSAQQMYAMLGAADQSGSFDSVTMAAFQAYLQQNFTASQHVRCRGGPGWGYHRSTWARWHANSQIRRDPAIVWNRIRRHKSAPARWPVSQRRAASGYGHRDGLRTGGGRRLRGAGRFGIGSD